MRTGERMELGLDFRNELNLERTIRKRWTFQVGSITLLLERSAWALLTPTSALALSIPSGDEGRGGKRLALVLGQVQPKRHVWSQDNTAADKINCLSTSLSSRRSLTKRTWLILNKDLEKMKSQTRPRPHSRNP